MFWIFYMRQLINLSGFVDDLDDLSVLSYFIKMYLREDLNLPIDIDPLNVRKVEITSETHDVKYQYQLSTKGFFLDIELTPKE